ncbi:translation initiation factor IF-3 [Candidatus Saccharibacteria bacterium]|nr:translation initiation factor IF-3 [Candidatus Saccharibacteria bacterium]
MGNERHTIGERVRVNGDIRYAEVRVLGEDGEQLGVMTSAKAQQLANEAGVDLVEISPNAKPPVVKIISWGKYQYQKSKEQNRARKNAKTSELRQIRLGLRIGDNDLNIKLKKVREFLDDGDRVKVTVVFRGREMAHKEIGYQMIEKISASLADVASPDSAPQMAGKQLSIGYRAKK